MLNEDPRARHLRRLPDAAAGSTPSRTAQDRLTGALRDRADAYRADATTDLTLVDVLVRMDQLEAAARTLDDHRACLQAMAHDLQVVVADAAVEREAERVYETCLRHTRARALRVGALRRRVVALTGAAAVLVALLLPSSRISPRTTLASIADRVTHDEIAEARSRLDAARSTAEAVRAEGSGQPAATAAVNNPAVRRQVRAILAADAPGESAAPPSAAQDVPVLARVRAARHRASSGPRRSGAGEKGRIANVVPLRERDDRPAPQAAEAATRDDGATEVAPPEPAPSPDGLTAPTD